MYRYTTGAKLFVFLALTICTFTLSAQEPVEKRYSIFFPAGRSNIDSTYMDNGHTMKALIDDIRTSMDIEGVIPDSLLIYSSSSPEGPAALNRKLASQRAENTKNLLIKLFPQFNQEKIMMESRVNGWSGLMQAIRLDSTIVHKETILKILKDDSIQDKTSALRSHPAAYAEIRDSIFNYMRTATVTLRLIGKQDEYASDPAPTSAAKSIEEISEEDSTEVPVENIEDNGTQDDVVAKEILETENTATEDERVSDSTKPFYMAIKSNMLYDAAAVPNVGMEFYLGRNFSIVGNWMYSWWKSDKAAWYWRIYGGDLEMRYWFGKAAEKKPLTGHHIGLYGQILTYDFIAGKRGYLGDRWTYAAGIAYGYSLPITKRLNIDFDLGLGYLSGEYKEYIPIDGHYAWQATKYRRMFGPTKAEISLVWLLGNGNINDRKGGRK